MKQIRNFGIFAHVDAGKTTLSEQLLATSGAIRQVGKVDLGTAHTDRMAIEKKRGISVRSSCACFSYQDIAFYLIDTPGHTDFIAEVERSMWALDGAILILNGMDSMKPQTMHLFETLHAQKIPCVLFVNKVDGMQRSKEECLKECRDKLSPYIFDAENEENAFEVLAECDEDALEAFLSGQMWTKDKVTASLTPYVHSQNAYPLYFGSALRAEGISSLLNGLVTFLPPPPWHNDELCGIVFSLENDRSLGYGCYVRLFSGELQNRNVVNLSGHSPSKNDEKTQGKITQIRAIDAEGIGKDVGILHAGEIGVVYGLGAVKVGTVLGNEALLPRPMQVGQMQTPLLQAKVVPTQKEKAKELFAILQELTLLDPLLKATWNQVTKETHVQLMGAIHVEVLQEIIKTNYQMDVTFEKPTVIYRETIKEECVGFVAYTMPKPCWAVLEFWLRPLKKGSGILYSSVVATEKIMQRYQNQVEQAIPMALKQGRLGWEVTDMEITLIGGEHHLLHTHPLDFIVATPMAMQDGLNRAENVLLEPILAVDFSVPVDCSNKLMADVLRMRGKVIESTIENDIFFLHAMLPLKESMDYSIDLARITSGKGMMTSKLAEYAPCPLELGEVAQRNSVDPLDQAKYILAVRNALESDIFS